MRANLKRLPLEFVNSIMVGENLREYSLSALIMHNTNSSNEDNTFLQHRAQCTSGTNDTKCTSLLLNFCKNYNIYTVAKLLYSGRVSRFQDNLDVFTALKKKTTIFSKMLFFPNPVNMHKFSLMTNVLQLNPVCSVCQYIPSSAPKKY